MANHLPTEKKLAVLTQLIEGSSVRTTERITGVHRDTICRLLARVGDGCASLLNERMVDLPCKRLELDELWSFVKVKEKRVRPTHEATQVGDQWVYLALCTDTKLVPTYLVGKRSADNTNFFVADLATRLRGRAQISTDGLRQYVLAIDQAFGAEVDYAMIVTSRAA